MKRIAMAFHAFAFLAIAGRAYSQELLQQVVFSPTGQDFYRDSVVVTLTCPSPDVQIFYTLDNTDPLGPSRIAYTGPFVLRNDTHLRAIPEKAGYSAIPNDKFYAITHPDHPYPIEFVNSYPPYFRDSAVVNLRCATPGAQIIYSLGETDPQGPDGKIYTGPFTLKSTIRVSAFSRKAPFPDSRTRTTLYTITASNGIRISIRNGHSPDIGIPKHDLLGRNLRISRKNQAVSIAFSSR